MSTIQVSARVDEEIRNKAQEVLEKQGLDISTAIRILITKTANDEEFPIDFKQKKTDDVLTKLLHERAKNAVRIDYKNKDEVEKLLDGWDEW